MKKYLIPQDILVMYIEALSFPDGIDNAFTALRKLIPTIERRRIFGISYLNSKGEIIYKAAVETSSIYEASQFGLNTFIIKKGTFMGLALENWRSQETKITQLFQKIIHQPNVLSTGYCLEEYINEQDMLCMVPLAE